LHKKENNNGGIMFYRVRFTVIFTFFIMISCFSCSEKEQEEEVVIRPVRYQQVFLTGSDRIRSFSGFAQAGQESRLSFKVAGTVKNVPVNVGDNVRAGNLIAELDSENYLLRVQQAQDALRQAEAQERNASANYERVRGLYENNTASLSELDGARSASDAAKAAVSAAGRNLELAKLSLGYTKLTAPVNGAIAALNIEVNENIGPGQVIVTLTSGSKIEVTVGIPEMLISQIRAGSSVRVNFDALPGKTFSARVTEVAVSTARQASTYPVTVRLSQEDPAIRPGMAAEVEFRFEAHGGRERFLVPSHSVGEDRKGRFVYLVEPISEETGYGTIHRKAVTIGDLTEDGLEVLEGISDGDLVVTAGVSRITEGQKVKM